MIILRDSEKYFKKFGIQSQFLIKKLDLMITINQTGYLVVQCSKSAIQDQEQRCPLSLLLFTIKLKILSSTFRHKIEIKIKTASEDVCR